MAGCSVVVLWLLALPIMMMGAAAGFGLVIYLIYSWLFESLFCACICKDVWQKSPVQGWIPLWGQYLLGKAAGSRGLGAALAADHLMVAGVCTASAFADPEVLWWMLLLFAALAVVLKAIAAHRLYKIAAPGQYKVLSVISILTLGVVRPVFLFALRKKVCMFSKNT